MIVFGYDGSDDARHAMTAASELLSGPALVVHVWEPVPPGAATAVATPGVMGAGLPRLAEAEDELERQAGKVVEEGVAHATAAGFDAEPLIVRAPGPVWSHLLEVAHARDARAIVVGRRGVSRLRGALLGSVSNGVVQHARVPVFVVPPPPSDEE